MQGGFRSERSCTHSIPTITEYLRTQIGSGLSAHACFIDKSVVYNVLQQKINAYGLRGPVYIIIDDYLKDKMQYVFWDNKRSTRLKFTTAVP